MSRSPALVIIAVLAGGRASGAQTDATVGIGLGTVRFAGGTSLGIVSLGPNLRLVAPGRELSLGGTVSALPRGDWYTQGRAAFWAATPALVSRWRLAVDLGLSGATQGVGTSTGAGLLVGEALWVATKWGLGLGAGTASGWITGEAPVSAFHARARGWWQAPTMPLALSVGLAPTRFSRDWFTDIDVRISTRRDRLEAGVSASARVSGVYGSKAAALATAEWRLAPNVSIEAGGGSLLPDPYQGFPRSGFIAAGARFHFSAGARGARVHHAGPLKITHRADNIVVQLRRPGVNSVSIAGNWNGWTQVPLAQVRPGVWEVVLHLSKGVHSFMLFLDGKAWVIPERVPTIPDGMGGRVAVVTIL
jgi:hypothetical protein